MKRFITILLTVVALAGVAAVSVSAAAPDRDAVYVPPPACQNLDIPTTGNPGWIHWDAGIFTMGTFRMARNCGVTFTYYGDGLRYDNSACIRLRLGVLGTDWTWDYNTRTIDVCGSGSAAITDPNLRVNDRFYIETWAASLNSRHSSDWPDGRATF